MYAGTAKAPTLCRSCGKETKGAHVILRGDKPYTVCGWCDEKVELRQGNALVGIANALLIEIGVGLVILLGVWLWLG